MVSTLEHMMITLDGVAQRVEREVSIRGIGEEAEGEAVGLGGGLGDAEGGFVGESNAVNRALLGLTSTEMEISGLWIRI